MPLLSRTGKISPQLLMLIVVADAILVLAVLAWLFLKSDPDPTPAPNRSAAEYRADLEKGEQALGLLENEEFKEATPLWMDLHQRYPEDPHLALNLALCRLGRLEKQLREIQSSNKLSDAEKAELQAEVPDLLKALETSAAEALKLAPASPAANRIVAAVKIEAANRQEYPNDIEYKKQAADFLLEALKRVPGDSVLAIRLHDLSEELGADAPDLRRYRGTGFSRRGGWSATGGSSRTRRSTPPLPARCRSTNSTRR